MAAISGTEQSTMINQLPNNNSEGGNDAEFVNNILNQMGNDNKESDTNYRETQESYQQQQFGVDPGQIDQQNQQQLMEQQMMEQQQQQQMMQNQQYMDQPPVEEKKSMLVRIKEQVKNPLIFFAIFILLTIPFVRKLILTQIQKLTESANIALWSTTLISAAQIQCL